MIVSFDVWNTLLDINVMLDALSSSLAELLGISDEEAKLEILKAREEIKKLRKAQKGSPERALEESQELLAKELNTNVEVVKRAAVKAVLKVAEEIIIDGALETLKAVKTEHTIITVGNVMFWPSAYTRLILERFGLADFIDRQFYSDELKAYKPMREFFEKALSHFPQSKALHIGDTFEEDFKGALNAGLYAVWINPEAEGVRRIEERGFEVRQIRDLLDVLRSLK
ncbi:hypothetical protein PAP_05410 [Palaeococcus pacificus DY20341]|uniref:2-haloalkanoic acid dehalogenase n=1 Tax=Palaeococcus pacificus DY20341 TaxID=1343739 RepID=A0A075LRU8_9EURY|nr:HAD family hydrolase [Palaeococcus pacificus]AIF69485.1 hypothetical protein PAP_05410 [Palaeococcus pacificus DY20341]